MAPPCGPLAIWFQHPTRSRPSEVRADLPLGPFGPVAASRPPGSFRSYEGLMMDTKQLLVADVMTLDPIVVDVDASIEEARRLLNANSISGLPVVDGAGALVGVISQEQLIRSYDPCISCATRFLDLNVESVP
jgi:hypothetical protein